MEKPLKRINTSTQDLELDCLPCDESLDNINSVDDDLSSISNLSDSEDLQFRRNVGSKKSKHSMESEALRIGDLRLISKQLNSIIMAQIIRDIRNKYQTFGAFEIVKIYQNLGFRAVGLICTEVDAPSDHFIHKAAINKQMIAGVLRMGSYFDLQIGDNILIYDPLVASISGWGDVLFLQFYEKAEEDVI